MFTTTRQPDQNRLTAGLNHPTQAIKGFGLARDFIARIESPDYSPFRMAALHSTPIEMEASRLEAERKAREAEAKRVKNEKARLNRSPEEEKQKQREYHLARMAKRHAENPDMPYRVVRTPEEKKEHLAALNKAKHARAKARKAAAVQAVYAYPQGPDGRFLPKKPGEVFVPLAR